MSEKLTGDNRRFDEELGSYALIEENSYTT